MIDYIVAYREKQKSGTSSQKIVETIQANPTLLDLVQRPLLLAMMLEVFTDPKEIKEIQEARWSITRLYQKYTKRWLRHEASKPDAILKWHEKATLLQELAWFSYMELLIAPFPSSHVALSHGELWSFVRSIVHRFPGITTHQLMDDLCFRTLLGISENEMYAFLHASFQEYYVALYVFECMRDRNREAVEYVLQTSLPFDIAIFLKDMLRESAIYEKTQITTNLIHVYQHNRMEDRRSTTIRQQASHYLTSLAIHPAIEFLRQVCDEDLLMTIPLALLQKPSAKD